MKKIILIILTGFSLSLLQAQVMNYPTDTIRGKVYYRYPVQKSEGLYRISKNFGVSQEEILRHNPELAHSGLRLGQTILIPVVSKIDSAQYIIHEIQPKETLYGLSKRYGVRIAEIQALNPETSKNMPIGARLLIPRSKHPQTVTISKTETAIAKVEKVEEVKIADKNIVTQKEDVTPATILDLSKLFGQTPDSLQALVVDSTTQDKPLRIAYLLPLMTNQAKRTPAVDRFVEFYEGALLAIYDAQRAGQRFEVYVYDTEKNDVRIQTILQQSEMPMMDAIIGPAYPSQITYISQFAYTNKIPTLIPFTNKVSDIDINPYLLQFNPSEQSMADSLLAYAQVTYPEANYIFVETETDRPSANTAAMLQNLGKGNYKRIRASALLNDSLPTLLQADKENILIFNTEKYAAVDLLLTKAKMLTPTYAIRTVSHYGWHDEMLPIAGFYTSVFNKQQIIDLPLTTYTLRFKHFFGHEITSKAPRYDLLGHDLTAWMVDYLQQKPDSTGQIEVPYYEGLQSDLHFKKTAERGGYENTQILIMHQ